MFLVRNEGLKLVATDLNGLAVAAAAIGGIGQIVKTGVTGPSWSTAIWIAISLSLPVTGQFFHQEAARMTWADLYGPFMFLVAGAGAALIALGFERWSSHSRPRD